MGKRVKDDDFGFVPDEPMREPVKKPADDFGFVPDEPKKKESTGLDASTTTGSPQSQVANTPPVVPMPSPEELKKAGADMAKAFASNKPKDTTLTPEKVDAFNKAVSAGKARKEAYAGGVEPDLPTQKRADQMKADKELNEAIKMIDNVGMAPTVEKEAAKQYVTEIIKGKDESELYSVLNDPGAAANQFAGNFNKAIISTAAAIPKSVAVLAKPLDTFFGIQDKSTEEYETYQAGQWLEDKALQWGITATDPKRDQSFWQSTIPNALGSVAALILTGGESALTSGTLKAATTLTARQAATQALGAAGKAMMSRAGVVGSMAMAVPEFEAARAAGMSDEDAFGVWAKNYFVGATEILPIQNALSRINKLSGGKLIDVVKAGVPGGFEEGLQETVQQTISNKIAQGSYDPERDTFQDVLESAGAGFFVGFILPGIGAAMKNMNPEQRAATQTIINDKLKQYAQAKETPIADQVQTPPAVKDTPVVEAPITSEQAPEVAEPAPAEQVIDQPEETNPAEVIEPQAEVPIEESSTSVVEEPVQETDAEPAPVVEEEAPMEEVPEEPTPEPKNEGIAEGKPVDFTWLGDEKKGTVTGITSKGKIKIKSDDGVNFTVDAADVKLRALPVKKKPTIRGTEKKIAKLKEQIINNTEDFKLGDGKLTALTQKGAVIMTRYENLRKQLNTLKAQSYEGQQASTEKFYDIPLGAPKKGKPNNRIKVAPIYGGKPKLLKDIVLDLAKSKPGSIYYTKSPAKGRRALGAYTPSLGTTGVRYKGDLDTVAHESGHELDDRYGIVEAIPQNIQKNVHRELMDLSQYGSTPPKGHPNASKYRLGEGMAEYIRAYLVNPDVASQKYPETTAWIKQAVPAEVLAKFDAFGNDIRTFSGLSAHDQIMSNLQFEPEKKKNSILEFFKPKSVSEDGFKITWLDRLAQKFTTDKAFFNKAVRFLEEAQGTKLNPSEDPIMLARVFLGSNEKLDNIFEKGLVNGRNQRVRDTVTNKHMTLEWLLEPFDNTDAKTLKEEQQQAITFMIAERTIELSNRFQRSDILTGIGGGIFRDTDVANRTLQEFEAMPTEKKDRIREAARRYREYADRTLKYMVEKGRISVEQYNQIKADNTQYIALNRILEAAPGEEIVVYKSDKGSNAIASGKNVLHKIKGSSDLIKNPYESLALATIKSTKEADRNEVMQAFRDLFTKARTMYQGQPVYNSVARPATQGDKNTVQVFVNGNSEYWQLQPDVYQSVKNITDTGYTVPAVWTALPRLLRASVTSFPVFALRNRIRDIQQRLIVSNTKAFKGYDIYFDKKKKELTKDLYQLFGGGQSGYYLMNDDFYYKKMDDAVKDLVKQKKTILSLPGRMADAYDKILSGGERATRLEEYRSAFKFAKEKGMDDYNASIYAAYKARDLLDFSVAGEWMRVVNQIIPFSNAAVQGLRKTVRSASNDPGGFALRFTLYAVIPALINRLFVHMQDEDEEYENMPNYRRDLFYNIPVGPDLWITVPRPFELGVLASSADRFVSKYAFDQENALDGYAGSVAKSVMPVDESVLAGGYKPFVEVLTNYDFFRDQTIIPPDEVGLKLEYRDTSKASRLGQALQSAVGVDARQLDYLIKSTTSYYGDLALRTADIGREDTRYPFNWSLSGLLKGDPLYDSRNVQKVMQFVKENGIHWSDPLYQELNQIISSYYETEDPVLRDKIGEEAREFAGRVLKEYESNEAYRRENQTLEE